MSGMKINKNEKGVYFLWDQNKKKKTLFFFTPKIKYLIEYLLMNLK